MHRRSRNYLDHNRAKMDAISRFPAAVLETERHLDVLLLQRCPNDERALADMARSLTPGAGPKRKRKKKKTEVAGAVPVSPMRVAAASSASPTTPSGQVQPAELSAAVGSPPGHQSLDSWEQRLQELRAFREQHGHCYVPRKFPENQALAYWVDRQRSDYRNLAKGKSSKMTQERIAILKQVGFEWDCTQRETGTQGPETNTPVAAGGVPMTTPITGMLHPSDAPQVYAIQQKTVQKAMARLAANDGSGVGKTLPPNASGYPNLTGRTALPAIAETANGKKKKKSSKGKKADEQGNGNKAGKLKDASKKAPAQPKKIKHKVRKRNVGGPVPPEYAKAIQRSWLDNDDVLMPDTKQFIPQTGDLIL
jgi:hypothetical protein